MTAHWIIASPSRWMVVSAGISLTRETIDRSVAVSASDSSQWRRNSRIIISMGMRSSVGRLGRRTAKVPMRNGQIPSSATPRSKMWMALCNGQRSSSGGSTTAFSSPTTASVRAVIIMARPRPRRQQNLLVIWRSRENRTGAGRTAVRSTSGVPPALNRLLASATDGGYGRISRQGWTRLGLAISKSYFAYFGG